MRYIVTDADGNILRTVTSDPVNIKLQLSTDGTHIYELLSDAGQIDDHVVKIDHNTGQIVAQDGMPDDHQNIGAEISLIDPTTIPPEPPGPVEQPVVQPIQVGFQPAPLAGL